jgi:hypothetical protein
LGNSIIKDVFFFHRSTDTQVFLHPNFLRQRSSDFLTTRISLVPVASELGSYLTLAKFIFPTVGFLFGGKK